MIYIYYYYSLPTASARFSRAADAVVSILYFVLSCHDCLRTHDVAYVYTPNNLHVYHMDIWYIIIIVIVRHTYEQRVAKTTVAPRLGDKRQLYIIIMYIRENVKTRSKKKLIRRKKRSADINNIMAVQVIIARYSMDGYT